MTALVDYVRYNNLPSLEDANVSRQAPPVDDIINGPIRDVFLKHAAHLTLCLYLQHRHHAIGTEEAIVKVGGTAHLMDRQAIEDIVSFGNKIVPTTWMTSGGKVLPMEFTVVSATATTPAPGLSFLSDFLSILTSYGLEGLFGIDTKVEGACCEMSIGDSSVVVPSNESYSYDQEKFIPVVFGFDEKRLGFTVGKNCKRQVKHTTKPPPPYPPPKPKPTPGPTQKNTASTDGPERV